MRYDTKEKPCVPVSMCECIGPPASLCAETELAEEVCVCVCVDLCMCVCFIFLVCLLRSSSGKGVPRKRENQERWVSLGSRVLAKF